MTIQKICSKCHETKDISLFPHQNKDGKIISNSWCKACMSFYKKQYYKENKEEIGRKQKVYNKLHKEERAAYFEQYNEDNKEALSEYREEYYQENKEDKLEYAKEYRNREDIKIKNSEYQKEYRENNTDQLSEYIQDYQLKNKDSLNEKRRLRKKNDINFKLRTSISSYISFQLRTSGKSKESDSCLKYLTYSIQELRDHLESLFDPWMSWDNYGKYSKNTWNDNDQSTWTWNIDHLIPRSDLPYSSMTDDNFKKCWALSNLRPLSAKQNMIDGTSRARHAKK